MRRFVAWLVVAALIVPVSVVGQSPSASPDPSVTRNLCLTVTGPLVQSVEELTERVQEGTITLDAFVDGECVQGTEPSPVPAADEPLPIEVIDMGFTVQGEYLYYAVVVQNPNPSAWVADFMPVQLDFLDDNGDLVTTATDTITLFPGQTSALVEQVSDARGAKRLEVYVSNGEDDWEVIDYEPGEFTFSQVKTRQDRLSATTTGRMTGDFLERQEDVTVIAVYRNKAGKVLGGWEDFVEFVPAGGSASFKIEGFTKYPPIAKTEMYYEH
jgi:hypothetical protein